MLASALFVLLGLLLLFLGGEGLVRGSSRLALKLGLTPLVVGLTVVAFGTSAPELIVSIRAALAGQGDIAIGNVLGSNILNIGLILALTALIYPLKVELQILRIDMPILIAVTAIGAWVLSDRYVSRLEGAFLAAGLLTYVWITVLLARSVKPPAEVVEEFAEALPTPRGGIGRDLLFIIGGLALLVAGSRFMVDGSVSLARAFGISEAVIGLTVVAVGTSMPELAAGVIAALKKEPDIALGNIVGSNIFNVLGIMGGAALANPITGAGIKMSDLFVAMGFAVLLVPILWNGMKIQRWEGAVLFLAYVSYVATLWPK